LRSKKAINYEKVAGSLKRMKLHGCDCTVSWLKIICGGERCVGGVIIVGLQGWTGHIVMLGVTDWRALLWDVALILVDSTVSLASRTGDTCAKLAHSVGRRVLQRYAGFAQTQSMAISSSVG